jgi:hypothetical protein
MMRIIPTVLRFLAGRLYAMAESRDLKRAMPSVMSDLDRDMPSLLQQATPHLMERAIEATVERHTGAAATIEQVADVVRLYDVISAAARNRR